MRHYRFIGEGKGVPGLPHRLTDVEAGKLGVEEILTAALEAGTYEEVVESPPPGDFETQIKRVKKAEKKSSAHFWKED